MTTSEEYEEQSAQCMVWAGNSAEQQRTLDAQLNAMGGIQQALLAAVVELRRLNEGRDQWYREVLEVLSAAKPEDMAPLRCDVCGKPGHVPQCLIGPLTRDQWKTHYASLYQRCMDNGGYKTEAHRQAATKMHDMFGPCPEESP